jgi:hypothetical protein
MAVDQRIASAERDGPSGGVLPGAAPTRCFARSRPRTHVATRRLPLALVLAAGAALVGAPAAYSAPCGEKDPNGKPPSTQPVRAMLALDEKSSRTIVAFKRAKGHQGINLVFTASGCELPTNPAKPRLVMLTKSGSKDLPDSALSVKSVEADGAEYILKVDVDANAFGPGTYDGQLAARAQYLAPTNRTPVSVSRSDNRWWLPILIGALAGLAGLVWFGLLKAASQTALTVGRGMLIFVVAACMVAGAISVFVSYWDQEVWSFSENFIGALTAGFTGATTGAMAGLLGVVWKQPAAGPARPAANPAAAGDGSGGATATPAGAG